MIKRVFRSKFDIENLSKLRTAIVNEIDSFDYKGIVVNKPWGYEYLMFENPYVAIWVLYLKPNHSTSMHCHPTKKTSLIVLDGSIHCNTLNGWVKRKKGEGLIIDEAVFHSSKAKSKNGAFIMEIESPPNKRDLVRLKDEYGREGKGYEDEGQMSKDYRKYEYIDFHKGKYKPKKIKNSVISIYEHTTKGDIHEALMQEQGKIICLLKGKLYDQEGSVVLSAGESLHISQLIKKNRTLVSYDIVYLTIHQANE